MRQVRVMKHFEMFTEYFNRTRDKDLSEMEMKNNKLSKYSWKKQLFVLSFSSIRIFQGRDTRIYNT